MIGLVRGCGYWCHCGLYEGRMFGMESAVSSSRSENKEGVLLLPRKAEVSATLPPGMLWQVPSASSTCLAPSASQRHEILGRT